MPSAFACAVHRPSTAAHIPVLSSHKAGVALTRPATYTRLERTQSSGHLPWEYLGRPAIGLYLWKGSKSNSHNSASEQAKVFPRSSADSFEALLCTATDQSWAAKGFPPVSLGPFRDCGMKFGKRLGVEAQRRWQPFYLNYKACKRAIQEDVILKDGRGRNFDIVLRHELHKISAFYVDKEEELEATMSTLQRGSPPALAAFRSEVTDLRKFVALNYIAVIKACKKRNRHLLAASGSHAFIPLRAVDLLSQQYFFTSGKLASLATQAELMSQQNIPGPAAGDLLAEYGCPICLDLLHLPVVLTCAHRFCWGCLVAHCATACQGHEHARDVATKGDKAHGFLNDVVAEESSGTAVATYNCPVCRKAQLLDLDHITVEPHLHNFVEDLRRRQAGDATSPSTGARSAPGSATLPTPTIIDAVEFSALSLTLTPAPVCSREAETTSTTVMETCSMDLDVAVRASSEDLTDPCPSLANPNDHKMVATPEQFVPAAPPACLASPDTTSDAESCTASSELPLLPPQAPRVKGRLTVVLDLDGTLISSYTPKRAPRLPPGATSYIVGRGGRLNPQGVFVVERPGLKQFFSELSEFAEIVLFTAGLEDYAQPIINELHRRYNCFPKELRLYRPATSPCSIYPCIKDLSRLGRDLKRTVLVDDTPLAFLRQPDNGVPCCQFRGDVDDRVLVEATLPLLQSMAEMGDVRPMLHRRYDMHSWFVAQGVELEAALARDPKRVGETFAPVVPSRRALHLRPAVTGPRQLAPSLLSDERVAPKSTLFVSDFDKTFTDFDCGERVVEELAPELLPLLTALEMPANFVPITNQVFAEMARRGISRDRILSTVRSLGAELPPATSRMLRWAYGRGIDVRVLSDCNSVFIGHVLQGAKVHHHITEVVTNLASFERVPMVKKRVPVDAPEADISAGPPSLIESSTFSSDSAQDLVAAAANAPYGGKSGSSCSSHRLVIYPRHEAEEKPHGCPLCPANLCKGMELSTLSTSFPYTRIAYAGDGANDLCPALSLDSNGVVFARKGYALERLLAERGAFAADPAENRVAAKVLVWENHEHLLRLVQSELA